MVGLCLAVVRGLMPEALIPIALQGLPPIALMLEALIPIALQGLIPIALMLEA